MSLEYKKPVSYGKLIDALLDDAFGVLQHDSGEYDPEWHHGRAALAEKFKKTLGNKSASSRKKLARREALSNISGVRGRGEKSNGNVR